MDGEVIGVLGIVFNWDGLAQTIVHKTPIDATFKEKSRVCIFESDGQIIADSHHRQLQDTVHFACLPTIIERKHGFLIDDRKGERYCIAFAYSPGYEGYRAGWHSLITQKV